MKNSSLLKTMTLTFLVFVVGELLLELMGTILVSSNRKDSVFHRFSAYHQVITFFQGPAPPSSTKPFLLDQPHLLLILSYQRCGSSFFGGLFDQSPNSFFVYEPLDSVYNAMYGTQEGWNVPSDIMNWKNGTIRPIPEVELRAVSGFLQNLFACDYGDVPSEFLLHKFWLLFENFQTQLAPFFRCMNEKVGFYRIVQCQKQLRGKCPWRFGRDAARQDLCLSNLWNMKTNTTNNAPPVGPFRNYSQCMTKYRQLADYCITGLENMCQKTPFRSIKTVRATMDSVEPLILTNPNLRVIHLLRDPRAVVLSRQKFHESAKSLFAGDDLAKEAKLFCNNLVHDVTVRRHLEDKYPGVFKQIIYDDFVTDPMTHTRDIYAFMNVTVEKKLEDWVVKNTEDRANSSEIASKWLSTLSYHKGREITQQCLEFFELVPRDWML